MATLDELVFYCRSENPIGAMFLLGDSGCGKTYLVENELQEALQDTHIIVRVSLFGINSFEALHKAVKDKWVSALVPSYSNQEHQAEKMVIGKNFINAVNAVLRAFSPTIGYLGDAASNIMNDVIILPVVEDVHSKKTKKVVLVFDDVDCTMLNPLELMGTINDYCENRNFLTIVVGNKENIAELINQNTALVRTAKEKAIAYMVHIHPEFEKIVRSLIAGKKWQSMEYAAFLRRHEETIIKIFASDNAVTTGAGDDVVLGKCHNLRCLTTALEGFFRVYYHMTEAGMKDLAPYLHSFLVFYLAERGGILRNGRTSYIHTDEELGRLYPEFSPAYLMDSVRVWICEGYWNTERFLEELSHARERV